MRALVLAGLASALIAGASIGAMAAGPEPRVGVIKAEPADVVIGAWELYRSLFVTETGRVVDDDNGSISHSESQGYGMLLAAGAGDRASFDLIWQWTRQELFLRDDGLAAWKWDPAAEPHVADMNNATDGDLLIAWALLRGSLAWKDEALRVDARRIADAIIEHATATSDIGTLILPGTQGFDEESQPDAPVVNLSYWVFPAIAELETISPAMAKAKLIDSGLTLAKIARFGASSLPSDWIGFEGKGVAPARNFPTSFGYNAVRVPLYLAWYSRDRPDLLEPFADAWNADGPPTVRVVDVVDGIAMDPMVGPGYDALTELVACSLHRAEGAPRASAFEPTTYYPSTLHLLSLMALAERYPQCL